MGGFLEVNLLIKGRVTDKKNHKETLNSKKKLISPGEPIDYLSSIQSILKIVSMSYY